MIQVLLWSLFNDWYYYAREIFDNLRHLFLDAPDTIIKYDGNKNTVIKINKSDI